MFSPRNVLLGWRTCERAYARRRMPLWAYVQQAYARQRMPRLGFVFGLDNVHMCVCVCVCVCVVRGLNV